MVSQINGFYDSTQTNARGRQEETGPENIYSEKTGWEY